MKKMFKSDSQSRSKLSIKQETIRHLRERELHAVVGGASVDEGGCFTKQILCTSLYVMCDQHTSVNTYHPW